VANLSITEFSLAKLSAFDSDRQICGTVVDSISQNFLLQVLSWCLPKQASQFLYERTNSRCWRV